MRSYSSTYSWIYFEAPYELQHNQYKNHLIIKTLCIMCHEKVVESVGIITIFVSYFHFNSLLCADLQVWAPNLTLWKTQVEGDHRHEMNATYNSSSKIDHLRYNKAQFIKRKKRFRQLVSFFLWLNMKRNNPHRKNLKHVKGP